jgi:glycosyltransferase involved in cell wall biosynthesis
MQVGVPAVVSDRTSFPEIAGVGAILVSLEDNEVIAEKVIKLIEDEHYRKNLIDKGTTR